MKLIENWRHAWRWWSMHVAALGVVITAAAIAAPGLLLDIWKALPDEVVELLPDRVANWMELGLFAAMMVARIMRQRGVADDDV